MKSKSVTELQCNIIVLIIFMLWPLLGFLFYIFLSRYITNKSFLFIIFYGYIGYEFVINNPLLDSYRYAEDFKNLSYANSYGYILKSGQLDLYTFITMRLVHYFTDNVHFLFAVWGSIFGFFVAASFNTMNNIKFKNKSVILSGIILLIMFFLNSPLNINGVRFWTAAWIAFSGFLEYEISMRKRGLLFILVSPFVHTSFVLFVLIYFIYRILKIKKITLLKFIFVLYVILSYSISATSLADIISGYLDPANHFMTYLDSSYIAEREASSATRSMLNVIMTSLPIVIMTIYIMGFKIKEENPIILRILVFFLIFMIIINILSVIPSISRFHILGYLVFLFLIFIRQDIYSPKIKILLCGLLLFCFAGEIYIANEFLPDVLNIEILFPAFV